MILGLTSDQRWTEVSLEFYGRGCLFLLGGSAYSLPPQCVSSPAVSASIVEGLLVVCFHRGTPLQRSSDLGIRTTGQTKNVLQYSDRPTSVAFHVVYVVYVFLEKLKD
jgi:hypothetical protein